MEPFTISNQGLCAIEITPHGIAVAYTTTATTRQVDLCEFHPYQFGNQLNPDELKQQLSQIVTLHNLKKIKCNWILHPNYYHLTLVDAPNVLPAEYKKAIRWQIKDITNYPLEDTAVDIFYPDRGETAPKKIYVIAAQTSFLQTITQIIQECGLVPLAIDVREFAIRNLVANLAKQETIGLLSIADSHCLMVSIKQANVQFVRRFPLNMHNLQQSNYEDLITEIARSFTYCQTELKQELPTKFFIPPTLEFDDDMIQNIATSLNKDITRFKLQELVAFNNTLDPQLEAHCWVAAGGALRNAIKRK